MVERVDVPDEPLVGHFVLVEGEEGAECVGIEPLGEQDPVGSVAGEELVGVGALLADGKRNRLGEEVRQ